MVVVTIKYVCLSFRLKMSHSLKKMSQVIAITILVFEKCQCVNCRRIARLYITTPCFYLIMVK